MCHFNPPFFSISIAISKGTLSVAFNYGIIDLRVVSLSLKTTIILLLFILYLYCKLKFQGW